MRVPAIRLILVVCGIAGMSCYPDQIITSVTQLASVTTLVDSQSPSLQTARTFALPDTVVHARRDTTVAFIGHVGDAQILASVRQNLTAIGWQELTKVPPEVPDVVVLTVVFETTNTGVAYSNWWGGWGWWPGWPGYGPDWAWGYPGNAVTFTYETGTLAIVMLDTRHGDTSKRRVPILWAGAVNGVLTQSSLQGALTGIDQMFTQSPYLERQ